MVNMPQEIFMWEMEGNNTILQVKKQLILFFQMNTLLQNYSCNKL